MPRRVIDHWFGAAMLVVLLTPVNADAQGDASHLTGILDHAAIVENIRRTCDHTQPDLAERLAEACRAGGSEMPTCGRRSLS